MKYKIRQEKKPTLQTFGKYKAVAVHHQTVESRDITEEAAKVIPGLRAGDVQMVMSVVGEVISRHLRHGDKVRLEDWGLLKLEIESDKVESPEVFSARKHIRGVRLHFLPESQGGSPQLYQGIKFERERRVP